MPSARAPPAKRQSQSSTEATSNSQSPDTTPSPTTCSGDYVLSESTVLRLQRHTHADMLDWTNFECREWIAKIIYNAMSMSMEKARGIAAAWGYVHDGRSLSRATDVYLKNTFPDYCILIGCQREILGWNCKGCFQNKVLKERSVRLNDPRRRVAGPWHPRRRG